MDAGFVLALPFHHGDLEPDCVEVSMWGGGGLMHGIKIPLHDFALKMQGGGGGAYARGGVYLRDTTVVKLSSLNRKRSTSSSVP